MYLLDTGVISNFRRLKPHPNLLAWFGALPTSDVAVSVMTVFEIQSGVDLVRTKNPAKAGEIEYWLDGFVLTAGFQVLAIDIDIARLYARMFVTPSLKNFVMPDARSKQPRSGADLVIAATAIVHGATVVTANKNDFLRIHTEFALPSLYEPFAMEWSVGGPEGGPG